jgi:hypothetical protein
MILPELTVNRRNEVIEVSGDDSSFSTFPTLKACNVKQQVVHVLGVDLHSSVANCANTSKSGLFGYKKANNSCKQEF